MKRWSALAVVVLAGSLLLTVHPAAAGHALAAGTAASGKQLYAAKFGSQFGASVPGFHVSKGVLSYDGSDATSLIVPFQTKHHPNFAVEMSVRATSISAAQGLPGYGVTVRQSDTDASSGIFAGTFFSDNATFNEPLILWGSDSVGGNSFNPGTGWHTYRLEVKDTQYRLLIDKHAMVSFTIPEFRNDTEIGIFSSFTAIKVRSFKVFAFGSAPAPTALPPVETFDLQQSDLPAGFQASIGHYFTNQEVARETQVPLATVTGSGRVITYEIAYASQAETGMFFVSGTITAYSGPDAAKSDYQANVASDLKTLSASANATNVHQSTPAGLGDTATVLSFDYTTQNQPYRGYVVDLIRGRYRLNIDVSFVPESDSSAEATQAVAIAKAIDSRVQGASSS
jgi:hypothetical protein